MAIEFFEIVHRYPIFATVPEEERLSEEVIKNYYEDWFHNHYLKSKIQSLYNKLEVGACEAGGKGPAPFEKYWIPCQRPVAEGQKRCKFHGGKSVSETREAAKKAKRLEYLRTELARLEARRDNL